MYTHTNEPVSLVLLHLHTEGNKKRSANPGTSTALGEQSQSLCSHSELSDKMGQHRWSVHIMYNEEKLLYLNYIYVYVYN